MPDITMCEDGTCERHETCYRYRAIPNRYQSYFAGTPRKGDVCNYYYQTQTGDRLVKLKARP